MYDVEVLVRIGKNTPLRFSGLEYKRWSSSAHLLVDIKTDTVVSRVLFRRIERFAEIVTVTVSAQ